VDSSCKQLCGKTRSCGHPCGNICHSPFHCKEDKPCQFKILVTCSCQRIKKEATCGVSKTSIGNGDKSLKCDDECLRLERNRKLQLALNIDPEHTDDFVPYSTNTIDLYMDNPAWCQSQEKTFRAFAADPDEKRLRFKPMKNQERAFLHALAEDFGFDSESMDPEPHRHVSLFKTPRFVMAPMKTLAQCVRIKSQQEKTVSVNNVTSNAPFNALLVTKIRFGLTIEEMRNVLPKVPHFEINFLPSEEVVLRLQAHESRLETLKATLAKDFIAKGIGSVELCRVDDSLNVERREIDTEKLGKSIGGWSTVAAKAAAPKKPIIKAAPVKSSFVVLSTNEKAKKKAAVADDWEDEEDDL
jgi:transcriptional repressor NF-X1